MAVGRRDRTSTIDHRIVQKEVRHPDRRLLAEQTEKTVHSSMARVQVVSMDKLGMPM